MLPHEQVPNRYGTPDLSFNFHYFAIRKMHFLMRARALAVFPGGFGTLDELFEVLTLVQTGRMARLPILLFGEAFWRGVVNWEALVEAGTIAARDLELMRYVASPAEAIALDRRLARPRAVTPARHSGASNAGGSAMTTTGSAIWSAASPRARSTASSPRRWCAWRRRSSR